MTIKVTAKSPVAGDAIEVPLLVEAEGVTQYKNKALFVDLRSSNQFTADLTVDVPTNVVPDSTKIQVSAIGNVFIQFCERKYCLYNEIIVSGDVLGTALQNIDSLIQMPSGCGEQTMIGK